MFHMKISVMLHQFQTVLIILEKKIMVQITLIQHKIEVGFVKKEQVA